MTRDNLKIVLCSIAVVISAVTMGYNKSMYPYTLPAGKQGAALNCVRAEEGMKLELGKWYTNFSVCKKYADDNGLPLLAVWSNDGCIHCWYTDVVFIQEEFVEWQKTHDAGKVICCFMAGGADNVDQKNSSAYNWMWYGGGRKLNAFPFVVLWWKAGNVNVRLTGDEFCQGDSSAILSFTENTIPERVQNVIGEMESAFKDWRAEPPYSGGTFALEETSGHRLEVEDGTGLIPVGLVRDVSVAAVETNNLLSVVGPDGTTVGTVNVPWAGGQTNQTVMVDLSGVTFSSDGQAASLILKDGSGAEKATNRVTYVTGVSAANPLWLEERTASTLGWGEWTMDLDVAKAKAKGASGEAYTLVAVTGSLWCPDCSNTDRNFLDVEAGGDNRFKAWAQDNQVALAVIDVPAFTGPTVDDHARPTLLSRTPYASTLARAREYPASGADPALTNAVLRSGLGYLTRKGVTDEEARAVLERNRVLVSTNTDKGGFHRPEDSNAYRTGVPIFVLLRKDGSVAARLTRFAAVSPMADAKAKWGDIIKRFDEMLAIADAEGAHADDIENNYPGAGATAFAANGGEAAGEISHADFTDVFRLDGVGGNALQKVTVKGTTAAEVKLSFCKLDADGRKAVIGESVTGRLSDGVTLEETFTEPGDYYLEVTGADITSAAFDVASTKAENFHAFTVSGAVVLVPQQAAATASAPAGSTEVVIRLKKGVLYRITGLAAGNAALEAGGGDDFYKALADGDATLTTQTAGGKVTYQEWVPGTYGFRTGARTVSESVGTVEVILQRTGGVSGAVTVEVVLDTEFTTLVDAFGNPRYTFEAVTLTWADGEAGEKKVTISVKDDDTFDGVGVVALETRHVSGWAAAAQEEYRLTVTENDKQSPGQIAFVGANPFYARKGTVYAKAGAGATLFLDRKEATDGEVSVAVSAGNAELGGDVSEGRVTWDNRDGDQKAVRVTGLTPGRSQIVKIASPEGGVKIVSASNTVRIVTVRDDAPEFAASVSSRVALYRYISFSNVYALAASSLDGKVTFTKLSGILPAGLKVSYDAAAHAMAVHGTPSAHAGRYEAVYQVKAGTVAGLTKHIVFTVTDPTGASGGGSPGVANPAVAKTRVFRDIPVVDVEGRRLAGVIQMTIPQRGNVSAKYTCNSGSIALSAKGWTSFDPETGALSAMLANRNGFSAVVTCEADGAVKILVSDPSDPEASLAGEADNASLWGKNAPATAWKGYYTVALKVRDTDIVEGTESLAPRGYGFLTLKMTTKSAVNTGKIKWAGMLPDGTSVSGSTVLTHAGDHALLPIMRASSADVLSVFAKIAANAVESENSRAVTSVDEVDSGWTHRGRDAHGAADFALDFDVYGGPYLSDRDLAACCSEYYETTEPYLQFDFSSLVWTSSGALSAASEETQVVVGPKTLTFADQKSVPDGMTMSLNRSTGVISGTLRIPVEGGAFISSKWKGVVLQGWGPGCNCAPDETETVYLPFVCGNYFFNDKLIKADGVGSMSVKRGGKVQVDSDTSK